MEPPCVSESIASEKMEWRGGTQGGEQAGRADTAQELIDTLELTGMPDKDLSLKRAIREWFAGRKKVLAESTVAGQLCDRCGKKGHKREGCPDRTQRESEDKGETEGWVRKLMNRPRINIAELNQGKSVQQGVAEWLDRGGRANEGNPWAHSTKREDALRRQLGYHYALGMSPVHLGWIGFGVPLNFIPERVPEVLAFRNHRSAEEEGEFVDKEHATGVREGSFRVVTRSVLKGICPLQVEKHPVSGKRRLCQDLRWINGHLPNVEFRMESLNVELGDIVRPGDKLFTTDIEKAYYCLAIHPQAQPYLGWKWRSSYYMPTCLVFGLSTAPRVFTKVMRPMMAFMRSLGIRVLGMIDDYMWAEQPDRILTVRAAVQAVLPRLGWTLNAKCVWEPADEVLMLGMLINTKEFVVRAPAKKVEAAVAAIKAVLEPHKRGSSFPPQLRSLERITGLLMSMMLALPAVRVFTRALYRCIAVTQEGMELERVVSGSRYPRGVVRLTQEAVEEMEFWLIRLYTHNSLPINSRETQVEVLLWSDASDVGWGGEAVGVAGGSAGKKAEETQGTEEGLESMTFGSLPRQEIGRSSTRRELVGLLQLVSTETILSQIRGKRIRVLMDSLPALRNLINGGGPKEELTAAVKEWTRFCEQHNVKPVYEWLPRAANWRADKASKLYHQQHVFSKAGTEERIREALTPLALAAGSTRAAQPHNHWLGKVPMFLPMFHQVDERVEMIRATLEEAIIVVPQWPAGGTHDWYRRLEHHSLARMDVGRSLELYAGSSVTGHNEKLIAFWLRGRRQEARANLKRGGGAHGAGGEATRQRLA